MILFRKEYIQANDNIKVDQELLEKTLESAFSEKQKKRVYSYRPMTSVAAAIVLVIGCTVAYPRLVDKPLIEEIEPVVTIAPVGDEFLPVVDVAPTTLPETTKSPEKKVLPTKKPAQNISPERTVRAEVVYPVVETQPPVADVPATVSETDQLVVDVPAVASETDQPASDVPTVARYIAEPVSQEDITGQLNITDEYVLMESDNENYVFENSDGKKFSVTVDETEEHLEEVVWEEDESGINLTFNNDDKVYTIKSENISKTELTEIFNEYIN